MKPTDVKYIVVHCSATNEKQDIGVKEIDRWHRMQGWLSVGYHMIIRRDGTVEKGRALDLVGAHVYGHNHESIGVCMVGGVDLRNRPKENFTDAQFDSLYSTINNLRQDFPNAEVLGHRDLSRDKNGDGVITPDEYMKACPSFDVRKWLLWREELDDARRRDNKHIVHPH